jgi:DHA1 family bicyclomycin/chloramphenicol resistance-like MFS transporter
MTRAPSLALLAAVTALGFATLHIVVPTVPLLTRVFGEDPAEVQLVVTMYLVGIAGGQLFYGPVSDRFGRRPVLLAGLCLYLAGTVLCTAAWSLPVLIGGRIMQAAGACAGIVLGRAIIRDVYDREAAARGIAVVMMTMTLAPAVSPAIGAYLALYVHWRAIFLLLGIGGAAIVALVFVRLPETNRRPMPLDIVGMAGAYVKLLRSPRFVGFALCSACASAAWFTFCASTPRVLDAVLHEPPSTYGEMILIPMALYMLGNGGAARFALRWGSVRLLVIGRLICFASGIGMVLWFVGAGLSPWTLFIPIGLCSIGDGLSQPATLASGLSVHPELAGTASGLIGSLQMTVAAIGTFIVAVLPYDIASSLIGVVTGFIGMALVFGMSALWRQPGGSSPAEPALAIGGGKSA